MGKQPPHARVDHRPAQSSELADQAALQERVERLERKNELLSRAMTHLLKADGRRSVLLAELAAATDGDWFSTGEIIHGAGRELRDALQACGIGTPRALANWLSAQEGLGVRRGERTNAGQLWQIVISDGP